MSRPLSALRTRLRQRLAGEDGVVLVLVALTMTVMLGCLALAIDLTSFYGAQKRAQAAADAAALAGAQDLPGSTTQAVADAQSYVTRNFPGATADITPSYGGDASKIKVGVSYNAPTFFAQIWGLTSERVSASAVAGANPAANHAAIFGYSDACGDPGVDFEGNHPDVNGGVYSNGTLTNNANGNGTIGPSTYGGPNGCTYTDNGNTSVASAAPSHTLTPYPIDYRSLPNLPNPCTQANDTPYAGDPSLTVWTQAVFPWTSQGATPIPNSIFCASQEIDLTAPEGIDAENDVFIAPKILLTANNSTFKAPASFPVMFWINNAASNTFALQGEHECMVGNIFDPTGTVNVEPNYSTDGCGNGMTGMIEANNVIISGNHFSINGTGPAIGTSGFGLSQ